MSRTIDIPYHRPNDCFYVNYCNQVDRLIKFHGWDHEAAIREALEEKPWLTRLLQ
jgi:hypothetical protein